MEERNSLRRVTWRCATLSRVVCALLCLWVSGCSDNIQECSVADMDAFQRIGPASPTVDLNRLVKANMASGPHRVLPGEVLEITMPAILQVVTSQPSGSDNEIQPYTVRVSDSGTITLPVVGEVLVAGHSLTEIEAYVIDAYHPAYANTRPSVYVDVVKPRLYRVSIAGGVETPGVYELEADQMSLVALLMEAGGVVEEGAACIRIDRSNSSIGVRQAMASTSAYQGAPANSSDTEGYSASFSGDPSADHAVNALPSDVALSFRAEGQSRSIGRLKISRNGRVLIDERIDLGSEAQRYSALARAVRADTSISMMAQEQKLGALYHRLNSGPQETNGGIAQGRSQSLVKPKIAELVSTADQSHGKDAVLTETLATHRPGAESREDDRSRTLLLPVTGLNVPFADIALYEGDSIVVSRVTASRFTVLGLVQKEGLFDFPPDTSYSLMEAIGLAGGLEKTPDPRWAVVYRLNRDGTIASLQVKVKDMNKGDASLSAMKLMIKPGDIVAVEHTPKTRSTAFLKSVFRVNFGMYIPVL